jgi:hypothetical protein
MVAIFGVSWVQLSQLEYIIPLDHRNPLNCVISRYYQQFSLSSMQWNFFVPLWMPPSFPLHLSFTSLFGGLVCRHQMYCVLLIHWLHTPRQNFCFGSQSFLPVCALNYKQPLSFYIFLSCYCLHLKFLKVLRFLLVCVVRHTNFLSTVDAIVVGEKLPELTTIYPACELCSINFCQWISQLALGNFCDSV